MKHHLLVLALSGSALPSDAAEILPNGIVLPRSHTKGAVEHTKGETGWEITEENVPKIFPGLTPLQCPVASGAARGFRSQRATRLADRS